MKKLLTILLIGSMTFFVNSNNELVVFPRMMLIGYLLQPNEDIREELKNPYYQDAVFRRALQRLKIWREQISLADEYQGSIIITESRLARILLQDPHSHLDLTMKLLLDKDDSLKEEKELAASLLFCLSIDEYIEVSEKALSSKNPNSLLYILNSNQPIGNKFDENYKNPKVIDFLSKVKSKYPTERESIDYTLDGTHFRMNKAYEERIFDCKTGERALPIRD